MKLEDTMLRDLSQSQRTNAARAYLQEVLGEVKYVDTEHSRVAARGQGAGRVRGMGAELQFGKMKKFWGWRVGIAPHHVTVLDATELYTQRPLRW